MNTFSFAVRRLGALVLDDNPFYRSMAAETLPTLGFARLELMGSVDDAVGLFKVFTPDIIFCDWRPDGFDGIAFTKALRKGALPIKRSTAIILVTAQSTSEIDKRGRRDRAQRRRRRVRDQAIHGEHSAGACRSRRPSTACVREQPCLFPTLPAPPARSGLRRSGASPIRSRTRG